ncbi:glycosyltransferase family 4 protein [Terribacillus sp. AE2B 122]|uniref:glycosyltransferase family 4 protein n=1 Tax=Terribacillus sp. AE2B 122 TaxID=1331902 RepID=UPI001582B6E8|nr:glycosyltransferase family 4 protein [Terribacillus sp. AE2B 122]
MNIGMISRYLPSEAKGGVGYQVHYLANHLSKLGIKVKIYSMCEKPKDALYDVEKIKMGRLASNKLLRTYSFAYKVRKIDFDNYDLLHTHGDDYLLKKQKAPILRTFYGSAKQEAKNSTSFGRFLRQATLYPLEFISGRKSDKNVAISDNTINDLPFIKKTIPCGVDLDRFSNGKETSLKEENPTILFVGTIGGRKRGELLLSNFKDIKKEIPNAKLWLVADKDVQGEGIISFGRVSTEKLIELYQRAWIFCLPSSYEGFGVPYIEALCSGTAVVATKNPGAIEILEKTNSGIISDDDEISKNIVSLITKKSLRYSLITNGLVSVNKYSWDIVTEQYIQEYKKLLKGDVYEKKEALR